VRVDGTLDLSGYSPTFNGLAGAGTVTSGSAGNVNLTLGDSNASSSFMGVIQDGSGTIGLTKTGTGTLTLSGTSTYTGKTIVQAGTLQLGTYNTTGIGLTNAGVAGPLGAPTGVNATIDLYNGVTLQMGNTNPRVNQATDRTINLAGSGTGTVSIRTNDNDTSFTFGAVTATGTGAKTLALFTGYQGNGDRESMIINGPISNADDGSPTSLQVTFTTQTGSESYVSLNSVNTFTGPITLVKGSNVNSAYLTIGGVRTKDGNTPGTGSLGNGNYPGAIFLDTNTTLFYDSSATQILAGQISGSGALTMSGPGMLTLSASNTYTGVTTLSGGVLAVGHDHAIGDTLTFSGGTIQSADATSHTLANTLNALTGNVTVGGSGNLTFSQRLQPSLPASVTPTPRANGLAGVKKSK